MWANFQKILKQPVIPVIISSAIATIITGGIQQLQILESLELMVYDKMTQILAKPGSDPRLLIVAMTEQDIQKWNWPLSGEVLDQLFAKLEENEPRAIGLDIIRDVPVQPGHEKLLERLKLSDIIVSVCKHSGSDPQKDPSIAPPTGTEPSQVGFINVVEDADAAIRRNLMLVDVDPSDTCQSPHSLSWQLALKHLAVGGISPKLTSNKEIQLRDVVFKRLHSDSGGYANTNAQGYQILLNYRYRKIAETVTITDVLSGKVQPNLVKDRIVLIGSTAPSLQDIKNTPFTGGSSGDKMPGVEIHGQIISQILGAVLDGQKLFWFLPGWMEIIWIGGWSVVGGLLAWKIRHPLGLGIAEAGSLVVLFGVNFVIFTQAGWFPVISPAMGLIVTGVGMLAYSSYQDKEEKDKIIKLWKEQEEIIAQLRTLKPRVPSNPVPTPEPTTTSSQTLGQELPLGTLLNKRYKIIKNLGGGGFGNTYLAEDVKRPRNAVCVVKQMRPSNQDPEYLKVVRRLFDNEANILEILGKHPQIPYLLAFFEENQQFYLVQEFIDGNSLSDELTPGVPRSRSEVINILKQVLQVLVFIHGYNVIHRDVKPSNLIRRKSDGQIVLIDFGAVKQVQPEDQEGQTIAIGTSMYAPGEQMSGMPRLNSDIYALGITAIEAFTGVKPKQRDYENGTVIMETGDNKWQYWWELADTTETLTTVINKMVHLDFTQRYQSAKEVLDILESL
jgi:CHASE2 domain-containing sensor protein